MDTEEVKSKHASHDATRMAQLATTHATLYRSPEDEPFACLRVDGHQENWLIRSTRFTRWLSRQYFEHAGKAPSRTALEGAINVLLGSALFASTVSPLHLRKAYHDGRLFLDLADEKWQVIEVAGDGWRPTSDSPVHFRRARGIQPLPMRQQGGRIEELRPFLNLQGEDDWRLIVAWLLAALGPDQPYPVLYLSGEQGSAKSTTAKVLRRLIDPNEADTRRPPKEPRDLHIAARNGAVVVLDNLSNLPNWLSDDLCSLTTGGGFSTRVLHTDDEEIIFSARRPVIVNGIGPVVRRSDLLDRCLPIRLPVISAERRRDENTLWVEFEKARPRILGSLLTAAASGLHNLPQTHPDRLPRLADFGRWVTACEEGLGWPTGGILDALWRRQDEASEMVVRSTPLGLLLEQFAHEVGEWTGTCKSLLNELSARADKAALQHGDWPGTPEALSHALERITPNLRRVGISIDKLERTSQGRQLRLIKA